MNLDPFKVRKHFTKKVEELKEQLRTCHNKEDRECIQSQMDSQGKIINELPNDRASWPKFLRRYDHLRADKEMKKKAYVKLKVLALYDYHKPLTIIVTP